MLPRLAAYLAAIALGTSGVLVHRRISKARPSGRKSPASLTPGGIAPKGAGGAVGRSKDTGLDRDQDLACSRRSSEASGDSDLSSSNWKEAAAQEPSSPAAAAMQTSLIDFATSGSVDVASLLQQLEEERAAHAATRSRLSAAEAKHAEVQAAQEALLRDAEQQRSTCRELQDAKAALEQQLAEARAAAAADLRRDTPSPNDLHRSASVRLRELQLERDSLAAQLAALTARALSRSPSSQHSGASSSGGAAGADTSSRDDGSSAGTPPSSSLVRTGSAVLDGAGPSPLADLLEGLQQLHVLTEDMVEAAEQVVTSSLMSTAELGSRDGADGEAAQQQQQQPHSPTHALRLLADRRSRLNSWGSGASTGDWGSQLGAARSALGASRLGLTGGSSTGTPMAAAAAGAAGLGHDAWGSGVFRPASGSGAGAGPQRWGSGMSTTESEGGGAGQQRLLGARKSGTGLAHWGSGLPSMGGLQENGGRLAAVMEGGSGATSTAQSASASAATTPKATAAASATTGRAAAAASPLASSQRVAEAGAPGEGSAEPAAGGAGAGSGSPEHQLESALLRVTLLEQQCAALSQQNLDLQIFVAQQEEKLLVSSEIMRRMQALSQTLATIRRAPSTSAVTRPSDTMH